MRPGFGIILLPVILSLAGCATPDSEYFRAEKVNSVEGYKTFLEKYPYSKYTNRAKNNIEKLNETERQKNQIKKNWLELSKGMSVDEVDSLLGPLNRSAVISIKNLANNQNTPDTFPYRDHFFTLIFDSTGKLSEWWLK